MDESTSSGTQGSSLSRLRSLVTEDPLSPNNRSPNACVRRLKLAAQMSDDGLQMMRMRLRRENASLKSMDVDRLIRDWLDDSPEPGFVEGLTVQNLARFTT